MKKGLFAALAALVLISSTYGAEMRNKIDWIGPTTRTDGSEFNSETEVTEYKVFSVYCDGTEKIQSAGNSLEFLDSYITTMIPCKVSYQLSVVDIYGLESDRTPVVEINNSVGRPNPPTILNVININISVSVE